MFPQVEMIKFASWELAAFFLYFARLSVNYRVLKPSYWTQLTRSLHNMTGNCLFDPFLLKYIHIYTYFVKKRDSHKIFRLRIKISWEPGSQVPGHYPTLIHCPL